MTDLQQGNYILIPHPTNAEVLLLKDGITGRCHTFLPRMPAKFIRKYKNIGGWM